MKLKDTRNAIVSANLRVVEQMSREALHAAKFGLEFVEKKQVKPAASRRSENRYEAADPTDMSRWAAANNRNFGANIGVAFDFVTK